MEPGMNDLLRWGIENSAKTTSSSSSAITATAENGHTISSEQITTTSRPPNPAAINALFNGPSDAELMIASMNTIVDSSLPLSERTTAFDNLEQLLESIDNSNLLPALKLWTPLVSQLSTPEAPMRMMAAWCIGTTVQNNPAGQERLLAFDGALGTLVNLATKVEDGEGETNVRRKAAYAISSAIRNYQPACDEVTKMLEISNVDAGDMQSVDKVMDIIRGRGKGENL